MDKRPIGVFDSGLGGLTAVRELRTPCRRKISSISAIPAVCPTVPAAAISFPVCEAGHRVPAPVRREIHHRCLRHRVQRALPRLRGERHSAYRAWWTPAGRPPPTDQTGRIGVIGTAATIRSRSYEAACASKKAGTLDRSRQAVPAVRAAGGGRLCGPQRPGQQQVTRLVIAQYLAEVREAGVDTLILGCTHYPLIKEMIGGTWAGTSPSSTRPRPPPTIWSGRSASMGCGKSRKGEAHFYVSDVPDSFAQTADLFLGRVQGRAHDRSPLINTDKDAKL